MPEERPVEDLYIDSMQISLSPFSVSMTLGRTPPHPVSPTQTPVEIVTVRTSLEHAKVMAMLLRKYLKDYERENGDIPIPPEVYTGLGVAREDWGL